MPEHMPSKSKIFLEAESLKVARKQTGCADLTAVQITRSASAGSGPNWVVEKFIPALPPIAESEARKAIDRLRGEYALDTK